MTKLILAPFDPAAKGSHAERIAVMRILDAYDHLKEPIADPQENHRRNMELIRLTLQLNKVLYHRFSTDNGTTVEEALEQISSDDYDAIALGALNEAGESTVPPENGLTSTALPVVSPARKRRGGQTSS